MVSERTARTEVLKAANSDNDITPMEIGTRSVSPLDIKISGLFTHVSQDFPKFPAFVHPYNIHTEEASKE
jgi:hypothetical protein